MAEAAAAHGRDLMQAFVARSARVGVVGLGYVGLPLAVEKAKVGFQVLGFDANPARVARVLAADSYIDDVAREDLEPWVQSGALEATTDFGRLGSCDVIVICVPTPLTPNRDPDISHIRKVGGQIAASLRPGQLVCLESTTYPGTTEEVLRPLLEATGLKVGEEVFLAFSPERVDPGNARYTTRNTNKVVGGCTAACLAVAEAFYRQTILSVVPVSSPAVAELTKVFENTFRAVNIALVNELALLCDRMGLDVWEVVDAAATKPFGMMRFEPGPGVGGHCIPIDPFYLTWKAREFDFHTRFIELAGEINAQMPWFVREKVIRALSEDGRGLKGSRILLVGVAYKRDLADWRESPALKVWDLLERDGAQITYHDPHVPEFPRAGRLECSVPLAGAPQADAVVIMTDHSGVDWPWLAGAARRIVDTRHALRHVSDLPSTVVRL
ncbi:MAG: nucleotide sugar dehydrogenase [Candidatus Sericytochromatia bacterium]|nr:nucleotide sugar dehydrogenase [Candidatus Sericytochromatia bacterium]